MRSTLIVVLAVLTGCAKRSYPEPPVHRDIREPDRDSIESVLYLVGDAGQATFQNSPVLRRLRSEVEDWSNTLTRENSLVVLYLGDNVYPRGLRDRTDPGWAQDSTHLQSQIDVVSGPNGKKNRARAVFIAGNHDWGHMPGAPGVARLRNMQDYIERRYLRCAAPGSWRDWAGDHRHQPARPSPSDRYRVVAARGRLHRQEQVPGAAG
jgi:hypothetical protein